MIEPPPYDTPLTMNTNITQVGRNEPLTMAWSTWFRDLSDYVDEQSNRIAELENELSDLKKQVEQLQGSNP